MTDDGFEEIPLDTLTTDPVDDAPAGASDAHTQRTPDGTRDRAATRAWEQALGLDRASAHSPALWRVSEGLPDDIPATTGDGSRIDPSLPRFRALLARLARLATR